MSKVIWEDIEAEYISSDLSYRQIAEKYKLAKSRVAKVGAEKGWAKKRKTYRANVAQATLSNTRVLKIRENSEKLTELLKAADKMAGFLNDAMNYPDSFYKQILMKGECQVIEDTEKLDTRAVKDIVTSIASMTTAVKELNNLIDEQNNSKNGTQIEIIEGETEWAK